MISVYCFERAIQSAVDSRETHHQEGYSAAVEEGEFGRSADV
jgi:hypothetical protein